MTTAAMPTSNGQMLEVMSLAFYCVVHRAGCDREIHGHEIGLVLDLDQGEAIRKNGNMYRFGEVSDGLDFQCAPMVAIEERDPST